MIKQGGKRPEFLGDKESFEFEQKLIEVRRVTRVTGGGKHLRFRACVVIGDQKGRVGYGVAKGAGRDYCY